MNSVVLIGRLTKDPEVRYTDSQMAVGTFTLAVDRPKKKDKKEQTADFIRITTFGKTAENCARYLSKGRQIAVTGMIRTGSYKNKNGDTVYTTDVCARNVEFMSGGKKDGAQGAADQRPAQRSSYPDPAYQGYQDDLPPGFETVDEDDIPF